MQKEYKILEEVHKLIEKKELDLAYKKLRKIYKQSPGNNIFKFELAKLMYIMGDEKLDKAEQYFADIYNKNHFVYAKLFIGKVKAKKNDTTSAKEIYKSLIGTTCGADALYELGQIEKSLGNNTLANDYFKKSRNAYLQNNEKQQTSSFDKRYLREIMDNYIGVHYGRNKIKHLKRLEKQKNEGN